MENSKEFRYINPLTDYGFKTVFGDEEIMREFLNDLLKPKSPITQVIFLNKDVQPDNESLRGIVYDMRCRTQKGDEIIVEMQNRGQSFFNDRILYYLAQSIAPQGHKGRLEVLGEDGDIIKESWNFDLKPVYGIFFLNFPLSNFEPRLIRTVRFMVEETKEVFNDKIRAYTVQLPCVKNMKEEDCRNEMDYWSYILYNMETMNTQLPFTQQKPIFMKMEEIASYSKMNTEQQRMYMDSLNNYRTVMAAKEYDFKRGMEKGIEKGMEEGLEQGRAEGRAEGIEQGILKVAKEMKNIGIDPDTIQKSTGLSLEEIAEL